MAAFENPANDVPGAQPWAAGRLWLAAALLAVAGMLAYANALSAPFIFDDLPAIVNNPEFPALRAAQPGLTITGLQAGSGIAGRPMVRWSLALNYALGGADVRGYHAFNVLVHVTAALALFGVARRTLRLCVQPVWLAREADALGFAMALLWTLHPLQTESVTCVIQRTESLAGLFFLLTCYGFVRGAVGAGSRGWLAMAWIACALGAATKELVAMAPVVILVFDRAFVAGTFAGAWRRRRGWYLAAVALWGILLVSVWDSDLRGGSAGFGHGVTAWEYLLTQCHALVLYLKLALWPHPLVLDYGAFVVRDAAAVWPQGLFVLALLGATGWALVRHPRAGFFGGWFFAILAPSSSFVPLVTQTMAEHRMYLPLAAVVVAGVLAIRAVAGRATRMVCALVAVGLGLTTVRRNADYQSVAGIWRDNLAKFPANARPHFTLAVLAAEAGRYVESVAHGEAAVRVMPDDVTAHFNLAVALAQAGRPEEAIERYRGAIRLKPDAIDPYINLGGLLVQLGRAVEAVPYCETAVRLKPDSALEHFNLAQTYFATGRTAEALPHYLTAVRLDPRAALTHYRLGHAYVRLQKLDEAVRAFAEAVRLQPEHFEAQANLAGALLTLGRAAEAVPVYERALRLRPGDAQIAAHLATARALAR